ncbi:MAG: hypothetical protein IKN55_11025 [Oscillospiraceae bacterium]|nr:hypothetical protein [Oscillospiraceae bacterium]
MSMSLCNMKQYNVILGDFVLHLTEYRLTGSCSVREQGTAQGTGTVIECWPKGTRLVLKGKLSDATDPAETAAVLDHVLRSGLTRGVRLGRLLYTNARLVGYGLGEGNGVPEVSLVFVTNTVLQTEENA